ncbi:DUF4235 domain-containing protein [Flindersiella endophytica]
MVVRTVSTVVAVTLTKKALDGSWRFVTGKEPPEKKPAGNPDAHLAETLVWVGASAIGIAAAQLVATKVAANRWQAWTGELPPGPKESKESKPKNTKPGNSLVLAGEKGKAKAGKAGKAVKRKARKLAKH